MPITFILYNRVLLLAQVPYLLICTSTFSMHELEPYYRWGKYYDSTQDPLSPFFGEEHSLMEYTNTIYGYYIHPQWDFIGSETLYIKLIFADYDLRFCVIELIGEWNDTLHNDIMHLKRNVVDKLVLQGINQFVLIGENVLNFHGSDDCYYEEWFDDVEDGWIAAVNFRDFVLAEMNKYNLDWYINSGGNLDTLDWRTYSPHSFYAHMKEQILKRIELS